MNRLRAVLIALSLVWSIPQVATSQTINDAERLIGQERYDDAVALLRTILAREPANAAAALKLARAYHWKKNFPDAKRWYQEAARLDGRQRLAVVPLLDELEESAAVIRLVEPEFMNGRRDPALLGALLTAYARSGQKAQAKTVAKALAETTYSQGSDRDYRNYVLAYHSLSEGDATASLSYLRLISNVAMRKYARTSPKFGALLGNPEFQKVTE